MSATQITDRTRRIMAVRSGGLCEVGRCRGPAGRGQRAAATELSHRNARGMGGTSNERQHLPSGLIHCCHRCHQGPGGIERNRAESYALGHLVADLDDPTTVPAWIVTVNGTGWWLLLDDGTFGYPPWPWPPAPGDRSLEI